MIKTNGGFLISQIKQIQSRLFDSYLRNYGIEEFNGAQGRILYILWQEDNLPIIELSKRTGLAKNTLTSMLDRMEKNNFLRRQYDQSDRRQIRIILTDKAVSLKDKYEAVSAAMNQTFYNGFQDDEIIAFEKYLERILNNLKEGIEHESRN